MKPKGKPISEVRRLVEEDLERLDRLAEVWGALMSDEQETIIRLARAFASKERVNVRQWQQALQDALAAEFGGHSVKVPE